MLFEGPAQSGGDLAPRLWPRHGASPRVRQNLALVVGLQGRLAKLKPSLKADQPAGEAEANVAFLKQLLSRKDGARAEADSAKAITR